MVRGRIAFCIESGPASQGAGGRSLFRQFPKVDIARWPLSFDFDLTPDNRSAKRGETLRRSQDFFRSEARVGVH
jgi:hypothetical protein